MKQHLQTCGKNHLKEPKNEIYKKEQIAKMRQEIESKFHFKTAEWTNKSSDIKLPYLYELSEWHSLSVFLRYARDVEETPSGHLLHLAKHVEKGYAVVKIWKRRNRKNNDR